MTSSPRFFAHPFLVVISAASLTLLVAHSDGSEKQRASETSGVSAGATAHDAGVVSDKPLAAFQSELLDIAFQTATKFPIRPHVVTRSRMQDEVAGTCFELDQPKRALHYIENIADWRRGKGYADFAYYCARHGDSPQVQTYLDRALDVAKSWSKEEDAQEWQADRIRTTIAKTHALLGNFAKADELSAGALDSEMARVDAAKAERMTAESFDSECDLLAGILAHGTFDQQKAALETCAQMFNRFYADIDRRKRAEDMIESSWSKLPLGVRVELLIELTEFALEHHDAKKAADVLDESLALVESAPWLPEDHLALTARLAGLRSRAGDAERARAEADATLAAYRSDREKIASFRRGEALRPLAEAYATMSDKKASLAMYKTIVEEGSANPNARARAENLAATCRSMARQRVEPDAELMARIKEIYDGLKDPW
jgi:hypothetical protein